MVGVKNNLHIKYLLTYVKNLKYRMKQKEYYFIVYIIDKCTIPKLHIYNFGDGYSFHFSQLKY